MAKKVVIVLAEGFEEIEAITCIDVLRRAELDVKTAGLSGKAVTGAHGVKVEADITLENYDGTADCVVLPGGMPGSKNLQNSKKVAELVKKMNGEGKWVTAICAAPALALASAGVLEGKRATCYPGFESNFAPSTKFSAESVVVDGNVVTSRGPGTAMQFALELVEKLAGRETAQGLRQGMLVN